MADVMKMVYGGTTVEFSPLDGYIEPDRLKIKRHESLSGVLYSYKVGLKIRKEISVSKISKADRDHIVSWWWNNYTLTYYPDLINYPDTTLFVKIVNDEKPLYMMFASGWANYYQGELIIQEI